MSHSSWNSQNTYAASQRSEEPAYIPANKYLGECSPIRELEVSRSSQGAGEACFQVMRVSCMRIQKKLNYSVLI